MKNYENFIGSGKFASFDNESGDLFWGNVGAGILPISKSTKRILISYRSKYVNEPNTWGIWGGKIDDNENIKETVIREFTEETNYHGNIDMIDAYVFKSQNNTFTFYNFIGIIDEEFVPELDWETEDYKWVTFEELLNIEPKHFGLIHLLNDEKSINIIKNLVE